MAARVRADFYEGVVQHIKPWTPPAPAVKARSDDDNPADDDRITGELPLKSVQRAATAPEWSPPDQATAEYEDLVNAVVTDDATTDQDDEPGTESANLADAASSQGASPDLTSD